MSNNNSNDFTVVVNIHEAKLFALDAMLEEAEAAKQDHLLAVCTKYGPIVRDHAMRVGNVENMDDIIAAAFEKIVLIASFPHMFEQTEVSFIKAIRNINGSDAFYATPFSRMAHTDENGEDVAFDDEVVSEDVVEQRADTTVSLDEILLEVAPNLDIERLEDMVNDVLKTALQEGDDERFLAVSYAWETYQQDIKLVPDSDGLNEHGKPLFAFSTETDIIDQDIARCELKGLNDRKMLLLDQKMNRGKGAYQVIAEDEAEYQEDASDDISAEDAHVSAWQDLDWDYTDEEFDMRRINPYAFAEFKATFKGMNLEERAEMFDQAWIGVSASITAVSETYQYVSFADILKQVWHTAAPRTDYEKAELLNILAHATAKKTGEEFEVVLERMIGILHLQDWYEDAYLVAEREEIDPTFISRVWFRESNWLDTFEMAWPGFNGKSADVFESIESTSAQPSETAVFQKAMAEALAAGLSYNTAVNQAWTAYRNATFSDTAKTVYNTRYNAKVALIPADATREVKRQMYMDAHRDAMRVARCVNGVTNTNAGQIVGLTQSGIKVNGKGAVEHMPWEKAIPMANRLFVDAGKVGSFIETAKKLGGQAKVFAVAFESVNKRRMELVA